MQMLKLFGFILTAVALNTTAAELAVKYEFVPSHEQVYQTSVVKPARTVEPIETAIIAPPVVRVKAKLPEIQIVTATNYPELQPLSPTISYSYTQSASTIPPESVVIPAKDYSRKIVNLTYSDLYADQINTFVVSSSSDILGYSQLSKGELVNIEQKISQNSLIGCAPLNINCSRTATDSVSLGVERGPIKAVEPTGDKKRQVITP